MYNSVIFDKCMHPYNPPDKISIVTICHQTLLQYYWLYSLCCTLHLCDLYIYNWGFLPLSSLYCTHPSTPICPLTITSLFSVFISLSFLSLLALVQNLEYSYHLLFLEKPSISWPLLWTAIKPLAYSFVIPLTYSVLLYGEFLHARRYIFNRERSHTTLFNKYLWNQSVRF